MIDLTLTENVSAGITFEALGQREQDSSILVSSTVSLHPDVKMEIEVDLFPAHSPTPKKSDANANAQQ